MLTRPFFIITVWVSQVILNCIVLHLYGLWLVQKNHATFFANQMQNLHKVRLGQSRIPALQVVKIRPHFAWTSLNWKPRLNIVKTKGKVITTANKQVNCQPETTQVYESRLVLVTKLIWESAASFEAIIHQSKTNPKQSRITVGT